MSQPPEPGDLSAAEAAAAEAAARAEAARTRAAELRRELDAARGEVASEPDTAASAAAPVTGRRWRPVLTATLTLAAVLALLGATGYMLWQHRRAVEERHRIGEFEAAGRQAVVNLMSMDFTTAKETVQRLIDDSTGRFKTNFQDTSADLIKAMQDAKVVTKVTVDDVAVESMTQDSGVVLVAATSVRDDAKATESEKQPRPWRVVITLDRDEGRLKLADFEFA